MKLTNKLMTIFICIITFAACTYNFFVKSFTPMAWLDFVFLVFLCIASLSDFHTMTIPDICPVCILSAGILFSIFSPGPLLPRLLGFVVISLPMLLLALFADGFGGGDIKLCAACGFYLGAPLVTLGTLLAAVLAAFFAILLLLLKKAGRKDIFCFGPFLSLGFTFSLLFGQSLLDSYLLLLL